MAQITITKIRNSGNPFHNEYHGALPGDIRSYDIRAVYTLVMSRSASLCDDTTEDLMGYIRYNEKRKRIFSQVNPRHVRNGLAAILKKRLIEKGFK